MSRDRDEPTAALFLVAAGLVALSHGCGPEGARTERTRTFSGGSPVCTEGPHEPSGTVRPRVTGVGPSSNAIERTGGTLWIVESGANTVSTWDLESQTYRSGVIDVGSGRNPYEIALDGERAFVTNWLANSVTVAKRTDGTVVDEIRADALDRPQDVVATDRKLYVTNVELRGRNEFGPGAITVIDRASRSVVRRIETAWKNPQFARIIQTSEGRRLVVSEAGTVAITDGTAELRSPGGIELWSLEEGPSASSREAYELGYDPESDIGAPGRPLPTSGGRYLYFTSATAPVLFKFDLRRDEWVRGISNPIRLYDGGPNALHRGFIGENGVIYVTAFNRDALYLFDTTCDKRLAGPIDLGRTPGQLEGPQQIVAVPRDDGVDAYFITLSNALGRVRLDY